MKTILAILLNLLFISATGQTTIDQAKALYNNKLYDKAKLLLLSIGNKSQDYASARYFLGRISYDLKRFDDAADYFEEAIEKNDKIVDYYNWLGFSYAMIAVNANPISQGLLAPKMKNAWEKVIQLDPNNTEARWSLIQFYTRAPSIMGGSIDKAKQMAAQIGKLNNAEGHRALGTIYMNEKKTLEAEKEFIEMTKLDPTRISVLANYYVGQKRYEKAFIILEDALAKNPNDYLSFYQIGKTSALTGQKLDRGEECLKKYLDHQPKVNEPSHAGANMRLGQIYEKKGNKVGAKKLFTAAITADANLKEAREGLVRVSK